MKNLYTTICRTIATICCLLFLSATATAQTYLVPGDIFFTGYDASPTIGNPDRFSFVLLTNITSGTTIYFTDRGYFGNNSWQSASGQDSTIQWTSGTVLPTGTQVYIEGLTAQVNSSTNGVVQLVNGSTINGMNLGAVGDQLIAFQGGNGEPVLANNYIAGLHWGRCGSEGNTTDNQWDLGSSCSVGAIPSYLPQGLSPSLSSLWMGATNQTTLSFTQASFINQSPYANVTALRNALLDKNQWNRSISSSSGTVPVPVGVFYFTPPASITANPVNRTVCAGTPTQFSISASNVNGYQWEVSIDNGSSFSPISPSAPQYSGITTSTLTVNTVVSMNNYRYRCVAQGSPSATSTAATLTVNRSAVIQQHPFPSTICEGDATLFYIAASNASSYQWQVNSGSGFVNVTNGSGPSGSIYSGAQSTVFIVNNASPTMSGYTYRCVASGSCSPSANSASAALTVLANITYYEDFDNDGYGNAGVITSTCTGAPGGFVSNSADCDDNNNTIYPGAAEICGDGVDNDCDGDVDETCITASIITHPSDVSICEFTMASFSVTAEGSNLTYQWEENYGSGFIAMPGQNSSTLDFTSFDYMDGNRYRCIVTATTGVPVISDEATLSVRGNLYLLPPGDESVCAGQSAYFSSYLSGTATLKWQVDKGSGFADITSSIGTDGEYYNGINGDFLNISGTSIAMSGYNYRLTATNGCGPTTVSSAATLTVTPSVTYYEDFDYDSYGNPNSSTESCIGIPDGYVTNDGDCNDYDTMIYPGATEICGDGIDNDCDGDVDETCVSASIISQPADVTVCTGEVANFTIVAEGDDLTYQWEQNDGNGFAAIPGEYSATLSFVPFNFMNGWSYRCMVTAVVGPPDISGFATLTVNEYVTYYEDWDNDGYGNTGITTSSCTGTPAGFVSNATDCDDANNTVYPGATEICGDGVDNDCDNAIDEDCAPVSNVIASQCNTTLTAINTPIYAEPDPTITQYRFRIINGANVQTIDVSDNSFNFTQLYSYEYETTYTIDVAVEYFGVWYPYGTACNVTTPVEPTNYDYQTAFPLNCEGAATGEFTPVSVDNDPEEFGFSQASNVWYTFTGDGNRQLITVNATSSDADTVLAVATRTNDTFTLVASNDDANGSLSSEVQFLSDGESTYYINVGSFPSDFGSFSVAVDCADAVSQVVPERCGTTLAHLDDEIYAVEIPGATQYRFRVTNGVDVQSIDVATNHFNLMQLPQYAVNTTYTIEVAIESFGGFGSFGVACTVNSPTIQGNDDSVNAYPLGCGSIIAGDLTGANGDEDINTFSSYPAPNVWYSFTGTDARQQVTVSTAGSDSDTILVVATKDTNGNFNIVGASDDTGIFLTSEVRFMADGGTTYYIMVRTYYGDEFTFNLSLDCNSCTAPANDAFSDAVVLTAGIGETGSLACANASTISDCYGGSQPYHDVWYTFEVGTDGAIEMNLDRTDISWAAYTLVDGELVLHYCGDSGTSFSYFVPNTTYYLRIYSFEFPEPGDFTIRYNVQNCSLPTVWNGTSWSRQAPIASQPAVIEGNFTSTGDIAACSLTVNSGVVSIQPGHNVTLSGAVTVNGGSLTFENNANLIQSTDVANSGNITVKRDARMIRQDYVYWGSPVTGQNLLDFSEQTLTNRFYTLSEVTNAYAAINPTSNDFIPATGYIIRAPNTFPANGSSAIFHGEFFGVPNNGPYETAISNSGLGKGFNMLGNPYPSPIDATQFLGANPGTLYFWTHSLQSAASGANYASFNLTGGTAAAIADLDVELPNGTIQTGQGFLLRVAANELGDGFANFDNSMRVANTDGQFFRTATTEKHRFWLNLNNAAGRMNQILIGYIEGATMGEDSSLDGRTVENGTAISSRIGNDTFVIQGRALPFASNDEVPLSFNATVADNYTIAIDHTDGLFAEGQSVFLKDNVLGTTHNLSESAYTFTASQGTYANRFAIVYQAAVLGVDMPVFDSNAVVIFKKEGVFNINSGAISMSDVRIFDVQGRLLYEKNKINGTTVQLNDFTGAQQVLLVQISTPQNGTVTKKVIN